jgi:hypothetical protein
MIVRYDPVSWREIPWDYGEEREKVGFDGFGPKIMGALVTPGHRSPSFWHMGGLWVSPRGHLVVHCPNSAEIGKAIPGGSKPEMRGFQAAHAAGKPYTPTIYPGRPRYSELHIWDAHGKLLMDDAFPGIGHLDGLAIDRDDNVYVMASVIRQVNGKSYDPALGDDHTETLIKVRPKQAKVISQGAAPGVPVTLGEGAGEKRPLDIAGFSVGPAWVKGAEWMYGGVGINGENNGGCCCASTRFALDYFGRSFAPEIRHFSVAVLDTNGNLILRVGRYGNVDDGKPLDPKGGPPNTRSIGGDETSLIHAAYVATHTDRRLFIADIGNARIASVKLGYHVEERVALKDVPDQKP